jgi:hypothetical protein
MSCGACNKVYSGGKRKTRRSKKHSHKRRGTRRH